MSKWLPASLRRCNSLICLLCLRQLSRSCARLARDSCKASPRYRGARLRNCDVLGRGGTVTVLDQKPLPRPHAHEHPGPAQLFTLYFELQIPLGERLLDILHFRLPRAAIPNHHRSTTIFALRDYTLELVVLDGVIFGLPCKTLVRRIGGGALWHGP